MCPTKFHKDYDPREFAYDRIERAWQAISGTHSEGRFFFIGHLVTPLSKGEWMAYQRRPVGDGTHQDVPFDYDGFIEVGDADNAIWKRAYEDLGWRIELMDAEFLRRKTE